MSRPMLLMPYSLLRDMHQLNKSGVPACKLIKLHNIPVTHPTLIKMIAHYDAMMSVAPDINLLPPDDAYELIHNSLFPSWLPINGEVMKQPPDWYYTGKFPLGKWQRREDNVSQTSNE